MRDEQPLFIDPAEEDPEKHIGFRAETPYPIGGSRRGEATIAALALDRPDLQEMRRGRLAEAMRSLRTVRVLKELRQQMGKLNRELQSLLEDHEAALKEYRGVATEFSSMLRAALS